MEKKKISGTHIVYLPEPPTGTLRLFDLYTIGLGCVIGAGIVSLTGQALALTGYSTWLAYIGAVLFGVILVIPYFIVGATLRVGGGEYSTIGGLLGEKYAGIFIVAKYLSPVFYATYGVSFGSYIVSIFPGANGRIAGVAILLVFFIINYFGIKVSSLLQNIMTVILFLGLIVFIFFGLGNIANPIFKFAGNPLMFSNGFSGFFDSVIVLSSISAGYYILPQFGRNAANAKRDIPKAMALVVPSVMVLYAGCAIVAAGVLPLGEVAGQPLTAVARAILPSGFFILFIIVVIMAILTSLNSIMVGMLQVFSQSVDNGWLPKALGKRNKHGTSVYILLLMTLLALIPVLLNANITTITRFLNLTNPICLGIFTISVFMLPKKYPKAWAKSKFYMSTWLLYILLCISLFCRLLMWINSMIKLPLGVVVPTLLIQAALIVYAIFRTKFIKEIKVSVWDGCTSSTTEINKTKTAEV